MGFLPDLLQVLASEYTCASSSIRCGTGTRHGACLNRNYNNLDIASREWRIGFAVFESVQRRGTRTDYPDSAAFVCSILTTRGLS